MKMEEILKESKEFKLLFSKSFNLMNGIFSSKIKGEGLEFIDLKEYEIGDDIRKIDWQISAREQKLFVKEFLEDKDADHYIIFDTSGSMSINNFNAKLLISSLLLSSYAEGINFSLWFANNNKIISNPLSKSKNDLMKYIYYLTKIKFESDFNLKDVLIRLLSVISKKSIVTIVTDELNYKEEDFKYLYALKEKNKVNFFQIVRSSELNLNEGFESYEDIESGESNIFDLSEEDILNYVNEYEKTIENIKFKLKTLEIPFKLLDMDKEFNKQLIMEV